MSKFDEAALELHRVNKGKLGVAAKVPVKNRDDLSKAYTPGVAAVSRAIAEDKSLMYEYTGKGNMVAVVSDGSAVLGLGNIGPEAAYPVMEGKSLLFKEFAGVEAFPIVLDTQNSDEIVRIVCALAPGFGGINLEDIAAPRCFEIEAELKRRLKIPIFHDDQHGTAIVVLAGLINALKVVGKNKSVKIVINGAGSAGMAITDLLHAYGFSNLTVVDSRGAIYLGREGLNAKKAAVAEFSNLEKREGGLDEMMNDSDVFIGVSKAGLVSQDMVRSMNEGAIVFAMANPDPEITEDDAKSAGAAVVATGRSDSVNQLNNVLVFPGLFRGALDARIEQFDQAMYVRAAEALAGLVENVEAESIIPSPFDEQVAEVVAAAV
ncbi:NADP-dependent malic enzyme [Candidatus Peregrinibacteria bacterium]|jgi:malate dehydrogenase (oxaloacetate-decarboxylating)|nr:NADP-dependent malic enzyme [Candidatus Peregrinibacteria bacterium]MBT4631458.1 NADP-dependent malic enzyme [Candidatus Peregrinibacteria bacterium]MBT5823847.1 NADP-dependent malic enzyme [Candidatus Peregrinibacteria bacterium]